MVEPAPRPRRRWTFRLGVLLVATGLILLGYVGWQMVVTTWISRREHAALVESLERTWTDDENDQDSTVAEGEVVPGQVEVEGHTALAVVRIPRFGDDFAVPLVEGVDDGALAAGLGRFPGTAAPGARGNFAIAGHRVTHGEPLRRMPELEAGDEVVIETRDRVYTYVLDTAGDALTVPFTETWVVDERPENPDAGEVQPASDSGRLLTLTTCSELFHTDGRLVAFGHLASERSRT